jgi:hypothetical protein
VTDSSAQCEFTYVEAKVKHVLHWCTLGGTSLASPLIASVFALAGGAAGVPYPARTLYQNEARAPTSLHDVVSGSNGACSKGSDSEGLSLCSSAEEAESCAAQLICLAGAGYDGPSGVGTPAGIGAFQRVEVEKATGEGVSATPVGQSGSAALTAAAGGSSGGGASIPPGAATAAHGGGPAIQISRLTMALNAILAHHRRSGRLSRVAFAFDINLPAHVRPTLARRVDAHGHLRWRALRGPQSFSAASGHNRRRLAGRSILPAGLYRLTLSPAGGAALSTIFHIG